MSITLGITSWQEGNSGWVATLNADLNRLASAVDSVSSGNISSGSISPLALNSDNSVTLGGILAVDSTTGHFYVKPSGVDFGDLPGQDSFTGGEIVRAKTDLSGVEPIPDNSVNFKKIDYAGSAGGIKIIMHNGTKPELYSELPTDNLPQIPIANLPIYTGGGTPLTGYVMKVYVSGGQITYLYPDITANSEETNRIKWTSALTDSPMYGDEFVTQKLPNYANIGKVAETDGNLVNPTSANFVGKIHDTSGSLVEYTASSYFGKAQNSSGASFIYLNDWQTSGDYNGQIRATAGGTLKYPNQYLLDDFRLPIQITVKALDRQIITGLQYGVCAPIGKTYSGTSVKSVMAFVDQKGITGSTTLQLLLNRSTSVLGDSTTQFDVTRPGTPDTNTTRYTYDGTGTNPSISDADSSLRVGDWILIKAQNFAAANTGYFKITAVGSSYFEVTNSAGSAESDKTIGTGFIRKIQKLHSSALSIGDAYSAETTSFISARNSLATGDILMIEVISTHTTPPYGLLVDIRTGGINVAD